MPITVEGMTTQQRNIYIFINPYRVEHGYSPAG
jgi:hypothetical protein